VRFPIAYLAIYNVWQTPEEDLGMPSVIQYSLFVLALAIIGCVIHSVTEPLRFLGA
jgi:hypothetical protein